MCQIFFENLVEFCCLFCKFDRLAGIGVMSDLCHVGPTKSASLMCHVGPTMSDLSTMSDIYASTRSDLSSLKYIY